MKQIERKHNRLKDFDYSQNGAYFITICTKDRQNILWEGTEEYSGASNIAMLLSPIGLAAQEAIENIQKYYKAVSVDKYVIMPNHIHMILLITCEEETSGRIVFAPTVSQIVKQMKTFVTKKAGLALWQKSFHDHIIRNEQDYHEVWEYIDTNPLKRKDDCYF